MTELAEFIQKKEPEIKGFSDKNLWRMKQFYETYKENPKLSPAVRELKGNATNKKGIYEYVLTGKERHLNIRAFTDNQKREAYERQKGICPVCTELYEINEMEGDHITPWHLGGKTSADSCQMLCKDDNRRKSGE